MADHDAASLALARRLQKEEDAANFASAEETSLALARQLEAEDQAADGDNTADAPGDDDDASLALAQRLFAEEEAAARQHEEEASLALARQLEAQMQLEDHYLQPAAAPAPQVPVMAHVLPGRRAAPLMPARVLPMPAESDAAPDTANEVNYTPPPPAHELVSRFQQAQGVPQGQHQWQVHQGPITTTTTHRVHTWNPADDSESEDETEHQPQLVLMQQPPPQAPPGGKVPEWIDDDDKELGPAWAQAQTQAVAWYQQHSYPPPGGTQEEEEEEEEDEDDDGYDHVEMYHQGNGVYAPGDHTQGGRFRV